MSIPLITALGGDGKGNSSGGSLTPEQTAKLTVVTNQQPTQALKFEINRFIDESLFLDLSTGDKTLQLEGVHTPIIGNYNYFLVNADGIGKIIKGTGIEVNYPIDLFTRNNGVLPAGVYWFYTTYNNNGIHLSAPALAAGSIEAPLLVTSTVEDAEPDTIVLTYDKALDAGSVPATTDFIPTSPSKSVSSVTILSNTVKVQMNSNYLLTDTGILLTYNVGANPVKSADGGVAASFTDRAVTNNITGVELSWKIGATNGVQLPTDGYLDFTNGVDTDTPFSISAWFYLDTSGRWLTVFSDNVSSGDRTMWLESQGDDKMQVGIYYNGGTIQNRRIIPTGVFALNQWNHVLIRYDGSVSYTLRMNINDVDQGATAGNVVTAPKNQSQNPRFGVSAVQGTKGGYIKKQAFWGRELSNAEVTELFNLGDKGALSGFSGIGDAIAYYNLTGDVLDSSGNGKNGSIVGTPVWEDPQNP